MTKISPKVLVLTGYGINCEEETAYVFEKAGGKPKIVHVNDLIDGLDNVKKYQILAIPGGFSYGDDTGAGNALSNRIRNNINEDILKFAQADKLVIGVCNGFQMLSNLGLVPATKNQYGKREVVLMWNNTARYSCRWVNTKVHSQKCIWTKGIDQIELPIAHGEGNFYAEPEILKELRDNDQIVLKYTRPDGSPANGESPFNPNGAIEDIAGITDPSGRILGLMPHPERFHSFLRHPTWTRMPKPLPEEGHGMKFFRNAVEYFK